MIIEDVLSSTIGQIDYKETFWEVSEKDLEKSWSLLEK